MAFFWEGNTGQISSPEQAARKRAVAQALLSQSGSGANNWGEGLARVAQALTGTVLEGRVSDAEAAGQERASALFSDLASGANPDAIIAALTSPDAAWATPAQSSIASALLQSGLERQDPMYQMGLEKAALELEALRNPAAPKPIEVGGVLLDPVTYQPLFDSRDGGAGLINAGGGNIYNPNTDQWITAPQAAGNGELTDTMRNLEWRAAEAGLTPGTPEYANFMLSGGQGGTSLSVDPTTGAVSFTQGFGNKPLTEGQSKDTVYATRAAGALPIIDQFGSALTDPIQRVMGADPTGIIRGNQTPEFQQAQQAGLEFLQAILRKDTGAAITPAETAEYGKVYLPVPGDSPELLEQKRISRQRALAAIEAGLPAQAILQSEEALLRSSGTQPPTEPAPSAAPDAAPAQGGMSQIPTFATQADFNAAPSGTVFKAPDGSIRVKP